jgi:hypothetical protein
VLEIPTLGFGDIMVHHGPALQCLRRTRQRNIFCGRRYGACTTREKHRHKSLVKVVALALAVE